MDLLITRGEPRLICSVIFLSISTSVLLPILTLFIQLLFVNPPSSLSYPNPLTLEKFAVTFQIIGIESSKKENLLATPRTRPVLYVFNTSLDSVYPFVYSPIVPIKHSLIKSINPPTIVNLFLFLYDGF